MIKIFLTLQTLLTVTLGQTSSQFLEVKSIKNNDQSRKTVIQQIYNAVKSPESELHNLSYNRLAYIVDTYGPRMWGSESQALAVQDLYAQLQNLGFDDVKLESLGTIQTWRRKYESLTLLDPRPVPQKLTMIGLGLSAPGNVTGEVVVVRNFDELNQLGEKVKGKIVCFNEEWTNYPETVKYRSAGPALAQKYGAIGFLIRSVASFSINNPHTGATHYDPNYPPVPAAAISVEDAKMFQRMQDRGQTIRVHLEMDNEWYESTSHNIVADIKGSEKPEEILLMGGHFDSWDTGSQTGANDDGGGVMVCLEALHVLAKLGIKPKRTIRFIAWSGEEMGLTGNGAQAYRDQHKDELDNHVVVFESDEGTTQPFGFGFSGSKRATKVIHELADKFLKPLGFGQIVDGDGEMVDSGYLLEEGVPALRNEIKDNESHDFYFTYHHSAGDTMDVMDPTDMNDNVVAIASMFYLISDLDQTLPRE